MNLGVQKSFFFEVVDQIPDTNEIHLKIMSSTTRYYSTSQVLNYKFQISKSLTHFFSAQRVIPRRIQQKYFNLIRKKITGAYLIIRSRRQNHMSKLQDKNIL